MKAIAWGVVLGVMALAAPLAGAVETYSGEPFCFEGIAGCLPTIVCVEGIFCQATPCDPLNDCDTWAYAEESCRVNETIAGETCASRLGGGVLVGGRNVAIPGNAIVPGSPIPPASVDVPEAGVAVDLDLTRGFVHEHNLPNDWISHAIRVRATVADLDLGDTSVGVYQSTIDTSNETEMHSFTHASVRARHDSGIAFTTATIGLSALDASLEECYARGGQANDVDLSCRDTMDLLGLP